MTGDAAVLALALARRKLQRLGFSDDAISKMIQSNNMIEFGMHWMSDKPKLDAKAQGELMNIWTHLKQMKMKVRVNSKSKSKSKENENEAVAENEHENINASGNESGNENVNVATDSDTNHADTYTHTYRRTPRGEYPAIEGYLTRCQNVTAVQLPQKYQNDTTYCPLILDGASGVGKTQQAFALLKNGKERLVYVLMTSRKESNEQNIYDEMRDFTKMDWDLGINNNDDHDGEEEVESFLELLDGAMSEAKHKAKKGEDAYRPKFIKRRLEEPKGYMAKLKEFLSKRVITYSHRDNEGSERLEIKEHNSLESIRNVSLKNIVLFIDEVLPPPPPSTFGEKREEVVFNRKRDIVYHRLRFLRSFGRASGMRTVLAGTAATAANIHKWAVPPAPAPSSSMYDSSTRQEADHVLWAEVEFLNPHIDHQIPLRQNKRQTTTTTTTLSKDSNSTETEDETVGDVVSVRVRVRPLLKTWLQSMGPFDSISDAISGIGTSLSQSKKIPDGSQMIWLSGAWLDSPHQRSTSTTTSSSPFRLKSSDLVRFHFFEPAISMDTEERGLYLGQGVGEIKRRQGPLRLRILTRPYNEAQEQKVVWALVVADNDGGFEFGNKEIPLSVGVSIHSRDIEYGLSHCIQQCLAKEPPLAVALSTTTGSLTPNRFRSAISAVFSQTIICQFSQGALTLDGKQLHHELVIFAALQLACQKNTGDLSTNTVRDFIAKIREYLQITVKEDRKSLLQHFISQQDFTTHQIEEGESKIEPIYKRHVLGEGKYSADDKEDDESQPYGGGKLDTIRLPWLVPACSEKALKEAHGKYGRLFHQDLHIAGLVPGTIDSRMDAEAYTWGESLEKEWGFEFKCQIDYDLVKGCDDLVRKCQVKKNDDSKTKEKKTITRHAMLIGISGKSQSGCQWWVEKGEYLRVVLVVNNSPY